MNQIESEIIDLLQGRIPKSIFAKHYFRADLRQDRIRVVLGALLKSIVR